MSAFMKIHDQKIISERPLLLLFLYLLSPLCREFTLMCLKQTMFMG